MNFWYGKRVLVTGGAGFIGSHLAERLVRDGAVVTVADSLETGSHENLADCWKAIEFLRGDLKDLAFAEKSCERKDTVFHMAARVGGVGYNINHQGTMFYDNVAMNTSLMEAARRAAVGRLLCMSSACVYRRHCTVPTPEEEGFLDDPEPTNLGYGWAKRVMEVQARCYADEFEMQIAVVRPYNTYGPRDNFHPDTAHVIPALIRRVAAGEDPIRVWGDGQQTRSFVFVSDIVEGILLAAEKGVGLGPFNIGTEEEVMIKDLVHLIVELSGLCRRVIFDTSRPTGQPRRNADISHAQMVLGYRPAVPLAEGLRRTVDWYQRESEKERSPATG